MLRKLALAMAASSLFSVPLIAQTTASANDPEFVAKLRTALRENPEIVLEAANLAQAKQRDAAAKAQSAKVEQFRPELFAARSIGPVLGNPKGTKTLVELLDYRCHYCQQASTDVNDLVRSDPNVRVVVVMRPILGPTSETLARFALAANLQGKFSQAHSALYDGTAKIEATDDGLKDLSAKIGVDWAKAKVDMTGDAVATMLRSHTELADKMDIHGTPFFMTGSKVIPGAPRPGDLKAAL